MSELHERLQDIDRTPVDPTEVNAYTREGEHGALAFRLLRELGSISVVAGMIIRSEDDTWDVREAILGGHLLRMFRMLRALLEQVNNSRPEIAWVVARMAVETAINLRYLLEYGDEGVVTSYLHQSLQHEIKLEGLIKKNIEARNGEVLPIETRMLASIERTFRNSLVRREDVPEAKIRHWSGKSLFGRAKALGLDEAYFSVFGGPSRNVHGNWQDLLQHNIESVSPGRFQPRDGDRPVRPQLLHSVGILCCEAIIDYAHSLGDDAQPLAGRCQEVLGRLEAANQLHEDFLTRRQKAR